MKINKYVTFTIFALIVLLFSYFRLTIISSGNVAYTYDQGRDFLAGARMVVDRDPVFIGPTTGMGGMFHGSWWYYVTALSFLILGSNPLSYYYFLFGIHLLALIVWIVVMRKYYGDVLAIFSSLIITAAPYYVSIQTFAGNNVLAIPSFTFFCLSLIALSKASSKSIQLKYGALLVFFLGLWAGFVAETELSFGIFLMPSIALLFALSRPFREFILQQRRLFYGACGLLIPFLPRLLFEVKNHFLQTKVLLGFFTNPKLYNPSSYSQVFFERIEQFYGHITQSTGSSAMWAMLLVLIAYGAYLSTKQSRKIKSTESPTHLSSIVWHLSTILFGLFIFSLMYKDSFWGNYYEGIQVGFLLLFVSLLAYVRGKSNSIYTFLLITSFVFIMPVVWDRLMATVFFKPTMSGVKLQSTVVQHIVDAQVERGERVFCTRVFTPPVIPHTYDYLWFHHYREGTVETPRYDYLNGRCWYIIEPEWKGFEFRQTKWKEQNIPPDATLIKGSEKIIEGITVAEYEQSTSKK